MLKKLWNASPAAITRSLAYRVRHALKLTQPPPRWRKIQNGPACGAEMLLSDAWTEMESGRFDQFIYDALHAAGSLAGATIWDIGAHVGYHTLGFAGLVGENGHVISFEPNPFNHERLAQNVARNPVLAARIQIEPLALTNQPGEIELRASDDVDGVMSSCSHLQPTAPSPRPSPPVGAREKDASESRSTRESPLTRPAATLSPSDGERDGESGTSPVQPPLDAEVYRAFKTVRVRATTVDAYMSAHSEARPRLLKIDVEGAEHLVLSGAKKCLAESRPLLLLEVHNVTCMFEVMSILRATNYRAQIIGPEQTTQSRCFLMATPDQVRIPAR